MLIAKKPRGGNGHEGEVNMKNTLHLLAVTVGFLVAMSPLTIDRNPQAASGLSIDSVSGTLQDGSIVTVTGSGFGTKPTGPPLKWDDFEAGTNASTLTGWDLTGATATFSSAVLRTASVMSARANFEGPDFSSHFGYEGTWTDNDVYLDAWYYYAAASPPSRNHKMFRFRAPSGEPNLAYTMFCGDGALLTQDGVSTGKWTQWTDYGTAYLRDRWSHVQLYIKQSSAGGTDGVARMWIDSNLIVDSDAWTTRDVGESTWDTLRLGDYMGHGSDSGCAASGDGHTYWDDVYVDNTRARIEIGDQGTYAASSHREIQLPNAWSDNSISIRLNRGGFTNLEGLYLYVIDAQGNASPGFPLSDSGAPPEVPAAPLNLRVVQ
jgi:hypothetical protein